MIDEGANRPAIITSPAKPAGSQLATAALFLVAGLVLGERFTYFPVLIFALSVLVLLVCRRTSMSSAPVGFILGALLCGLFYYQIVSRHDAISDLSPYVDKDLVTFEGQLEDPVRHYPDRQVGTLEIKEVILHRVHRKRSEAGYGSPWTGLIPDFSPAIFSGSRPSYARRKDLKTPAGSIMPSIFIVTASRPSRPSRIRRE